MLMNFEALVKHISTIQSTLQAQAAHAVNLALTARNWLMGCYIVEFEQNGEDRAAYGEQLLKKLEQRLNVKGLNERRFREFRRLYLVYPQLKEPVAQYIVSQNQIRHSLSAEFIEPIRRLPSAESATNIRRMSSAELDDAKRWMIPADRLFNRLHRKGRYDGEVRHRRIRPQHLCAEIHDRTAIGGRNQAVYFGRNPLRSGNHTCEKRRKALSLFSQAHILCRP